MGGPVQKAKGQEAKGVEIKEERNENKLAKGMVGKMVPKKS